MPTNPHPRNNPLAIAVEFDTVINGAKLNPHESFTVTGPTFVGQVPASAISKGLNILRDRPGTSFIKMIQLEGNKSLFYSIHFPKPGDERVLYMVPTKYDNTYDDKFKEFTESNQLDQVFSTSTPFTWRQAAINWTSEMSGYAGGVTAPSAGGDDVLKRISFSVIGNDTNLTEQTANFEVSLKFNA